MKVWIGLLKFYLFGFLLIQVSCTSNNAELEALNLLVYRLKSDCLENKEIDFDRGIKEFNHLKSELAQSRLTRSETRLLQKYNAVFDSVYNNCNVRKSEGLVINFYLDNSGSINGYLKGEGFRPIISRILNQSIENSSYNLFYSNSEVLKAEKNVDQFMEELTPKGVRKGDISNSNINNVFQSVLNEVNDSTVSIMVGDGIYSVGKADNPLDILKTKKESTVGKFSKRLKINDKIEAVVYQFEAGFDGYYYDYENGKHKWKAKRPFYIWFFGTGESINRLISEVNLEEAPGFKNKAHFFVPYNNDFNYAFSKVGKIGNYRIVRNSKGKRIENSKQKRNQDLFGFSVVMNLKELPLDKAYLMNPKNYHVNKEYRIDSIVEWSSIEEVKKENDVKITKIDFTPTHLFYLSSTDGVNRGTVILELNNRPFEWIEKSSNDNDKQPDEKTTFGFRYLMQGITEGFRKVNKDKDIFKIELEIN